MVKLTFVMPVYNAADFIDKSIESLLKQQNGDWNLLCIDDGSTDNSKEIIESYANKDKRISIICQQNQGPGVARANAFSIIKTEYVAILDADDTIADDYVLKILNRTKETNADIIMPDVKIIDKNNNIVSENSHFINNKLDESLIINDSKIAFDYSITWILHGWVTMKTELAKRFYTKDNVAYSKFNSDEYVTRLLYAKANIVALCSCYYYHRNENLLSGGFQDKYFDSLLTYEHLVELCFTLRRGSESLNKIYSLYRSCLYNLVFLNKLYNKGMDKKLKKSYLYYKKNFSMELWNYIGFSDKIKYLISLSGYSCLLNIAYIRRFIFKLIKK